jgi:cell division septation protein DedD
MVLDYSERRQVSKNRPVKRGIGLWVVLSVVVLSFTFAGGFLTGWLVGKAQRKEAAVERSARIDAGQADSGNTPGPSPVTGTAGGIDPPLTFYNTLPKGSKAVIGSGINAPAHQEKRAGAAPAAVPHVELKTPPAASPVRPQEVVPVKAPEEKQPAGGEKAAPATTGYLVQVASYKDKREAEEIRDRLVARGIAAYLAESRLKDRGVWFRVRVGKGLNQKEAGELASKLGKGALVLPE